MTAAAHPRRPDPRAMAAGSNTAARDAGPGVGADGGARAAAGGGLLAAIVVAISPFDVARPVDGWTALHLRPLLLTTAVLAAVILARRRAPVDRPLLAATAALVLGFVVAAAVSVDPATGFAVTVRVSVLGLLFMASASALGSQADRRRLVAGVGVGVVAATSIGLVTHLGGADRFGTEFLVGSISVTRGVTRLTRPFSHANVAAMYLAPAVVLLAGVSVGWVRGRRSEPGARVRRDRLLGAAAGLAALFGALALSLTLSRGGLLALVAGVVVLVAAGLRGRFGPSLVAVGLPLVVAAVAVGGGLVSGGWGPRLGTAPADVASVSAPAAPSRSTIWRQAIDAWLEEPVVGVGPGRFGPHTMASAADGEIAVAHAHNPFLEALATGGLVAATGVVVFTVTVVRRAWPGRASVPVWLSAALAAAMLPMVVDHPFAFSSSGNLAAVLGGAWYAAAREAHR